MRACVASCCLLSGYKGGGGGSWKIPNRELKSNSFHRCCHIHLSTSQNKYYLVPTGGRLPSSLRIHGDNTAAEVKNNHVLRFACALVWHDAFSSVDVTSDQVGHTHGRLDQRYSVISQQLSFGHVCCQQDTLPKSISPKHRCRATPPKNLGVAPPPPFCREVSHRNLGLKRCRATRRCRSYSCGCRATLCN